jgi:hypothetical protein
MTADEAISFIDKPGVVLAHSKCHDIHAVLQAVADSEDVLACRLVNGKVTLVHRRLWPALVRVATRFPSGRISQVYDEHTASGRHVSREVPFPKWVPPEVAERARGMSEKEAFDSLGPWSRKEAR